VIVEEAKVPSLEKSAEKKEEPLEISEEQKLAIDKAEAKRKAEKE
jgi:hypothetical protein